MNYIEYYAKQTASSALAQTRKAKEENNNGTSLWMGTPEDEGGIVKQVSIMPVRELFDGSASLNISSKNSQ